MSDATYNRWRSVASDPPPAGKVVLTAIIDETGERNTQPMSRRDDCPMWFLRDGSYVYYTPTHWKELP